MDDPGDNEVEHPLLEKQVHVCLDKENSIWLTGKLLRLNMYGEVEVEDEKGVIHYAWPALEIMEVL